MDDTVQHAAVPPLKLTSLQWNIINKRFVYGNVTC